MTRPWRHAYRDPAPPIRADARPVSGVDADTTAAAAATRPPAAAATRPPAAAATRPPAAAPTRPPAAVEEPARPHRTELPATQADSARDAVPLMLEPIGDGLLAVADGNAAIEDAADLARLLRREPDRLVVVLTGPVGGVVPELARRLRPWVQQGWESIRLVGSYAAAAGDCPPGQELADRLRVEVVAPDGQLLAVPDGSLFVVGSAATARHGAWWYFRPGRTPVQAGARFPEPDWQPELADLAVTGTDDIVVEQVPAGLWAHRPGVVELTDLAFAMPAEAHNVILLVSRAGDAPLPAVGLRSVVAGLPQAVRERLVAVPYGDQPLADARLGAVLAAAVGRGVRVRTGLTVQVDHRRPTVVAVDANGDPTWQPLVRELAWSPGGGPPRVVRWADPVADLFAVGLGQHAINERWLVELIEAGLWVRPLGRPLGAELVRQLPLDARLCTVVVGAPGCGRVFPPWRAIRRLLGLLPAEARMRLRLVVPADGGYHLARSATRACRRLLAGRPAYVLDAGGDMVPYRAEPRGFAASRTGPVPRTGRPRPDRSMAEAARLVAFLDTLQDDPGSSDGWDRLPPPTDNRYAHRRTDEPPPPTGERPGRATPSGTVDHREAAPPPPANQTVVAPHDAADVTPWTVAAADHVVRPDSHQPQTDSALPARGSDRDGAPAPATDQQSRRAG